MPSSFHLWNSPSPQLAEQYRRLADWIETYDTLPWQVGINWAKDGLLIHLKPETFQRLFSGYSAQQNIDPLGVTWTLQSEGLIFTCFIPTGMYQSQIQIPSQKESA